MLTDEQYNGAPKGERAGDYAALEEMRDVVEQYATIMDQNIREAEEDIEFVLGDQWDAAAKQVREEEEQVCLTFPKLTQFIDQVVGEEQQQAPSIRVRPADGWTAGQKIQTQNNREIDLATTYGGLIRQIERTSDARTAYDNAYEGAVTWGWGHWRIVDRYVDDSFDKELIITPVWDPFAVSWDAGAVEYTRADSNNCVIRAPVAKAEFRRRFSGATAADFDFGPQQTVHWLHGEEIYLAEWFRKEPHTYPVVLLSDGRLVRGDDVQKVKDELAMLGVTVVGERQHKGSKVTWRLCSGCDVLEGPIDVMSSFIPVVPVWGRMVFHQGRFRYRGLIRNAKDEQRAYNYARTAIIEAIALAPKAPYVAAAESVEPYQDIWSTANTRPHAYLPYKALRTADGSAIPPPRRESPGTNLAGLIEMMQMSETGMKSSIGIYDPSLGQRSNETSGRAIAARQQQGDRLTYPFVGNLAKSISYTGRILVDMIPRRYNNQRIVRILHDDDTDDTIEINQTIVDQQTGQEVRVNDMSVGRFDVTSDVGPSYLTRRMEAAQSLNDLIAQIPAAGPLLADLAVKNLDFPGADSAAERLRRGLVPPQVLETGDGSDLPPEAIAKIQEAEQAMQMMQAQLAELTEQLDTLTKQASKAEARAEKAEIALSREKAIADVKAEQQKFADLQASMQQPEQNSEVTGQIADIADTLAAQGDAIARLTEIVQQLRQAA